MAEDAIRQHPVSVVDKYYAHIAYRREATAMASKSGFDHSGATLPGGFYADVPSVLVGMVFTLAIIGKIVYVLRSLSEAAVEYERAKEMDRR